MSKLKIRVIGYDEIVLLFGLVGIEGRVVRSPEQFKKVFKKAVKDELLGVLIIAINLPIEILDELMEFKLKHRRPFLMYLPNVFEINMDKEDYFHKKIRTLIKDIII